jgi:hypothetical protein
MAFQIQPIDIADSHTLSEIEDEITAIKAAITIARQSSEDKFNDMQASQSVRRQTIADLYKELAIWIKAKNILTGADSATANQEAYNYNPTIPKV